MLQRSYSLAFVPLLFVLVLAGCTQDRTSNNNDASGPPVQPVSTTTQTMPTPVVFNQESVSLQESLSTVELARRLTPSVVQVVTSTLTVDFFNQPVPSGGVGTGIILDQEGHILTNNHVVADAQDIRVTLSNGESFPAELVG